MRFIVAVRRLHSGADAAKKVNARRVEKLEDMVAQCDVVTVVSYSTGVLALR